MSRARQPNEALFFLGPLAVAVIVFALAYRSAIVDVVRAALG